MTDPTDKSAWTNISGDYVATTSGSNDIDWDAINEENERIANEAKHKKFVSQWNKDFRHGNVKPIPKKKISPRKDFAMRRT